MFTTLFVIGAVGFAAMLFLSFGHVGGLRAGHHAISGGSHAPLHSGHGHVQGHGVGHSVSRASSIRSNVSRFLFLTPIDIFSVCLGTGAAGLLLQHLLAASVVIYAALLCGAAYNWVLIHPVMNLCMRFVSRESEGLEGTVATEVEAISNFDSHGRGLVRLTLDGQLRQLLATLDPAELERGVTISKGDKVIILEVDAAKNICRVSRDLAA